MSMVLWWDSMGFDGIFTDFDGLSWVYARCFHVSFIDFREASKALPWNLN